MKKTVVFLTGLVLLFAPGCASAKWLTGFSSPSWHLRLHKGAFGSGLNFDSDKEDEYVLEGLHTNPKTGEYSLDKLHIIAQSVPVINARKEYDKEVLLPAKDKEIELQRQIGQNIALGLAVGGETGAKIIDAVLAPVRGASVGVTTPIGGLNVQAGGGLRPTTTQPVEQLNVLE